MAERETLYVDVILPLAVEPTFTYRVPFEWNDFVQIGSRVIVPFGKSKLYTALIHSIHQTPPKNYSAKYLEFLLDETPIVHPGQLEFWEWMSDYYMCTRGEVFNAALPSNLKLASETKIVLHPDFDRSTELEDREWLIVEALEIKEVLTLKDVIDIIGIQTIQPIIKKMLDKRVLLTLETVQDKFKKKTATYIGLNSDLLPAERLEELVMQWEDSASKVKPLEVLMAVLSYGEYHDSHFTPFPKKRLEEAGFSSARIKTLQNNGVIDLFQMEISRLDKPDEKDLKKVNLAPEQKKALAEIKNHFNHQHICLLHGVTGSGKTEMYVELIEETIQKGKQVLFLVPEIALTTQLVNRLMHFFGQKIGVYHSKFNQNERVEIWNHVLENDPDKYNIVLGARSAIFLPFTNLGLIIVDEEHENSYKQTDPAPRYHARDAAIVLAQQFNAKVLLGSATPSMESYTNALAKKYGLVELKTRFSQVEMPEIQLADITKERKQNKNFNFFSTFLLDEIRQRLVDKEQVILFQNRRGYNPRWECEICSWTPRCENCDVSLTYHKKTNTLKCHYCGYLSAPVGTCKSCGSNRLKTIGFGTEKIEDELQLHFPEARISRMDFDTTRSKNAYADIIDEFSRGDTDILVGTQMISKGLDFNNVSLVGIMDADRMLNNPDFRAFEKSYQMMTQVAGRAGRKSKRGFVVIQTGQPDHWILEKIYRNDYEGFYHHEMLERNNFSYPPNFKLIDIILKHKDENIINLAADYFANHLKDIFQHRILGPEFPIIPRINNLFIKVIKIKIEKDLSHAKIRKKLKSMQSEFFSHHDFKTVRMTLDVDPV